MAMVEIEWTVEDGYIQNGRNHVVEIDAAEFDGCSSDDEIMEVIFGYVQESFADRIAPAVPRIAEYVDHMKMELGVE